jgi:HK97 family phage prohead protease
MAEMDTQTGRDLNAVMRKFGEVKRLRAAITKAPTDGSGRFVAMVSPFGLPPDAFGDVISPGAYASTIMQASVEHPGELWTIWYNHGYEDPSNAVGVVTAAAETSEGLVIGGHLAIDSNSKALGVYERLLEGTLREFSIGFGVTKSHEGSWGGKKIRYLDEIELLEISVVWKGAAAGTHLIEVRSANSTSASNATATLDGDSYEPDELALINARLDEIASGERPRDHDAASAVDDLILETRLEFVRESLDRAKQAAWERRMHINMVRDPVPVRVDARMRPVTS